MVVVHGAARRQPDDPGCRVDARSSVDDQFDARTEQRAVVDRGGTGTGHELMQPDPIDEFRTRIDQRDMDIGTNPQMVGGNRSGVTATDDDDPVVCVVFGHALGTPPARET